jgi:hypothetical protein
MTIERYLSEDHARLDRLLAASEAASGTIDAATYAEFRHDLLRHIAMEEKVLLRLARAKRGGEALPIATQLRADHGEIAKLLVPSPTPSIVAALRALLARHNALEEGPGGLYAICDQLAGDDAPEWLAQLRDQPRVPVAPHYDGPIHKAGH